MLKVQSEVTRKTMTRRLSALLLAMTMVLQLVAPQASFAKEGTTKTNGSGAKIAQQDKKKYRKIGAINGTSYDGKIMNALNREAAKNRKTQKAAPGFRLFSRGPYFGEGNEPKDPNKPKYYGNINVDFKLSGLDGDPFQWEKIFGVDEQGKPKPAQIIFVQTDDATGIETGIKYILKVTKTGTYTWSDENGEPTNLPLFSETLKPYKYEAHVDEDVAENIKLLTARMTGTEGSSPTFSPENADGKIIANITLDLGLQQVASTKFKSEWKTGVEETNRPQIQGTMEEKEPEFYVDPVVFDLPKNNKDVKIIRDWEDAFKDGLIIADALYKTPTVKLVETNENGLTFDTTKKTVKSGDHKYKYDFKYNVIDGGKLTMTEIIPVTFDANGGKFASITEEGAEQKIVKEVEYEKGVTAPEAPTKDRETFKGWGIKDGENIVAAKDADFEKIKSAKTFYAMWESKAFDAKGLTVFESFKDENGKYVNDFIPTLKQLKENVEVAGNALTDKDQLAILGDDGQPITGETAVKDYLYMKLGEVKDNQVDRTVQIKGRVTDAGGKTHDVTIPIKVIKNIYEAKTEEGKPNYVPKDYVKVTVDPTTKAKDPQKYFYYVNPKAQVVIPGKDPVGTPGNNFVNWTMKPDSEAPDVKGDVYTLADRNKFTEAATITANYVGNVVEQPDPNDDKTKPTVPKDFVKVIVNTTDKASDETKFTRVFWVKKDTPVRIEVKDPVAATAGEAFSKWKIEKEPNRFYIINLNDEHKFSKEETQIRAFYIGLAIEQKEGEPKPDTVPDNFIKVIFKTTDKANEEKQYTWWLAPKNDSVKFALEEPVGKEVKDGAGNILYKWEFGKLWKSKANEAKRDGDVDGKPMYKVDTTNVSDGETFYAQYTTANIIPYDPASPIDQPEGYVNVTFNAETGLSLKAPKAYYVKKNAGVTLQKLKDDTTKFGYPTVEEKAGYAFDMWEPADTTEIKDKDIVVTAKAKPVSDVIEKKEGVDQPQGYVEVTFVPTDKATDTATRTFWVNPEKEVTIPITDPKGKTYYTFTEWKIGANADGDAYKPTVGKKFTENTIITATYEEAKNIIPYDPKDPKTKPKGYVRVTFEADEGITLSNVKAYYVKEGANITLGNSEIAKPDKTAKTGYEFKGWDKEDSLVLGNDDVVVKALAKTLHDTIEKKEGEQKPDGYVEVKFVAGANGKLTEGNAEIAEKAYYVNPNKYVTLTPPEAKGNTGYEFGSWSQDATNSTQYTKPVTTITANFNPIKAVIPKIDDQTEKPDGYKIVTFEIEGKGGSIVDGETAVFYVDPTREVTIDPPTTLAKTGYEFDKWNQDTAKTAKMYTDDTTVKGSFKKLDDIVDGSKPKPDGYVTVTFDKGDHGKEITGQTVYYVNPEADPVKTLGDQSIAKPTVKAETGYKFTSWNFADTKEIQSNMTVIAQYKSIDDVIPKDKSTGGENDKPEGYITVTFDKGANGKLEGNTTFYINPNKAVVLEDKAPTIKPNTGYTSAGWDTTINKAIQYKDGDKITALYNQLGDVIPQEKTDGTDKPAGYLTVTFDKGEHGTLSGKTVYYVKPNKEVTVPAPTVKPSVGYEFEEWNQALKQTFNQDTKITALYKERENIIPQKKTDGSDRPDGYVTVTFKADTNGSLSGTTVYYVKPNVDIDLTDTAKNITKKANVGFTDEGGTWSPAIESNKYTKNETYTFTFKPLADFIEKIDENTKKPDGYVTVKLIPTNKATDETKAEKIYFVNPTKDVNIKNKPVGKEEKVNDITYKYTFTGWTTTKGTIASWDNENINGTFIQDTDITAKYSTKVDIGTLILAPVPKKDVVTPVGDKLKPEDLIKNVPGSENDPLPKGTKITYTDDGTPDVNNPGDTKAKVKVEYPNGKTVVVEVPIKVVDHVVPQTGGESGTKPLVPDSYVKVTVDTTEKAKANTKFTKVFWVKPGVEVTIPGILDPTGESVVEGGVTKTNKFVKWKLEGSDPEITYAHGTDIKGIFTAQESKIVADYEQDKNIDPTPDNGKWISKGTTPTAKEFIKNAYNDDDPNNPNNLPPRTSFKFVAGNEPKTNEQGKDKITRIEITYPNGEVRTVDVTYNVTGDVVEQPNPNDEGTKPVVPTNFVKVIVDKTNKAKLQAGEKQTQVFWVNPTKEVTIRVNPPEGKDEGRFKHVFTGWDHDLTAQFTKPETTIKAQYVEKKYDPEVDTYWVLTDKNVQPELKDYKDKIKPSSNEDFTVEEIVRRPDVSKPNTTSFATIRIKFNNGATKDVEVPVFVKPDPIIEEKPYPVPGDCNNSCDQPNQPNKPGEPNKPNQPNQPNQPNIGMDALNTTDHYQYLIGYPDGNFGPNKGMTRAEVATMFTRLLRQRPVKGQRYYTGFSDIQAGDWYANTVGYAVKVGIVSGYPDGSFKPNKPITRAEFAAIASRFDALAQGNNIAFSDLAPSHWGYAAIRSAASKGWITGYPDDTFRPEKAITRAEVTSITNRMLNRYADLYWIDAHRGEVIRFGDVKRSDWYFEPIMEATMGHDFIRDRDGKTEHWTGVNGKSFI